MHCGTGATLVRLTGLDSAMALCHNAFARTSERIPDDASLVTNGGAAYRGRLPDLPRSTD